MNVYVSCHKLFEISLGADTSKFEMVAKTCREKSVSRVQQSVLQHGTEMIKMELKQNEVRSLDSMESDAEKAGQKTRRCTPVLN